MDDEYKRMKTSIIIHICICMALLVLGLIGIILIDRSQKNTIVIAFFVWIGIFIGYLLFIRKKIEKKNSYVDNLYKKGEITTEQHDGSKNIQNVMRKIAYIILVIVCIIKFLSCIFK